MAPWPEPENEPKAPDKTSGVGPAGDKQIEERSFMVKSESVEEGDAAGTSKQADDRNPGVSELDDLQLKKLLDEAFTYKRPKDREGKSTLFRELLQEAEADESEHPGGQRGSGVTGGSSNRYRRGATRKGDVSERNSRGGSLQNLVFALNSDLDVHGGAGFNRKRGGRRNPQPQVSVSARQREGGSLPCNVNADYYTAAALLRSPDDLGTNSSAGKRLDNTTPIDDVVTGNAYSYKLSSAKYNSVAVDDLASYRVCNTGKRTAGSVDDIVTAAPRGTGSKRRELKKLGHSSDDIFTGACGSDDNRSVDDFRKESSDRDRFDDIRNDNVDICDVDTLENHDRVYNNVDNGRVDNPLIDIDIKARRNGPSLLGLGINGTVRTGPDRRWTKSESRKDDDLDGTEMMPLERSSDILKYSSIRSTDHSSAMEEVDQSVDFLIRKARIPNGDGMVQLSPTYPAVGSLIGPPPAGESLRGTIDSLGDAVPGSDKVPTRARQQPCFASVQISQWDKDMRFLRVDSGLRNIQQILTTKDSEKKSYDENGNSVNQYQTPGLEQKKYKKKCKTDKNPYVLSDSLPGHRGNVEDINELLLFIESDSPDVKSTISGKNSRNSNGPVSLKDSKQRNNSSNGKRNEDNSHKVKPDKRKSTDKNKLQKSNSLEEISHTKLSDLTSSESIPPTGKAGVERRPKKQTTLDDDMSTSAVEAAQKQSRPIASSGSSSDRRSWGPEDSSHSPDGEVSRGRKRKGVDQDRKRGRGSCSGSCSSSSRKHSESSSLHRASESDVHATPASQTDTQLADPTEFHVVTKKQRKKKSGRSSSIGRNERSQNYGQSSAYHLKESHSRRSATVEGNDSSVLYHYRSVPYRAESPDHSQHHRRKSTSSMPPSDKSADSSDLDSVHSLPISSTTPRPVIDKTSTSSGSTPQASYADIARMASAFSPPQGQVCSSGHGSNILSETLACSKWPSVGQTQARPSAPLWTANVTLHAATPLPAPASHEEGDQSFTSPPNSAVTTVSSPNICNSAKRDAMTNTVSLSESEQTDSSSVGNLLSDHSYPPLCESGKPQQAVTQCVKTFITQASRTSPAVSHGVTMANCVDVEDSAKRAASPSLDSARDNARTSAVDRPAVIILDEGETETPSEGDPELTFGFEINEMLLSGTCTVSSDDEESRLEPPPVVTKVQPAATSIANINLDKIVAYVGRAWEDVMKELPSEAGVRGRVQYYSGQ